MWENKKARLKTRWASETVRIAFGKQVHEAALLSLVVPIWGIDFRERLFYCDTPFPTSIIMASSTITKLSINSPLGCNQLPERQRTSNIA
jgi:hypothetical protein